MSQEIGFIEKFKIDLKNEKPENLIFLSKKIIVIGYVSGFIDIYDFDIENDDYSTKSSFQTSLSSVRSLQKYSESEFFVGGDKDINLYNIKSELLRSLQGHDDSVEFLRMDGSTLYSASEDCTVCSWSIKSSSSSQLYSHTSSIISMDLSSELGYIATGCSDQDLIIYSIQNKEILKTDREIDSKIWSLKFVSNKKLLAIGTHDSNIILKKVPSLESFTILTGHESRIKDLDYCKETLLLVSASFDQKVGIWDLKTLELKSFELDHNDWVRKVIIDDNTKTILSIGDDSRLCIRKLKKQSTSKEILLKKLSEMENFALKELKSQVLSINLLIFIGLIYSKFCCIMLQLVFIALWLVYDFGLNIQYSGRMIYVKFGITGLILWILSYEFFYLIMISLSRFTMAVIISAACVGYEYYYEGKIILPYSLTRSAIICLMLGLITGRLHVFDFTDDKSFWLGVGVMAIWSVFEYISKAALSTNESFVMNFSVCLILNLTSRYLAGFAMKENDSFKIGLIVMIFYLLVKNIPGLIKQVFN